MLDLPIDGAGGRVVVSFREAGTTIDTGVESGVMLHKTTSDDYGLAWLVDATPVSTPDGDNVLPVGATITTGTGVAITVESVSDGSAVIRVHDPRSTTAPPSTTKPPCPWWWPFC
ncbi:hypothetical protein ACFQV2_24835 [Actinokineospora soli]|uniref:Uncharacterized protein n=1 Tax=Actinokineospora soli TaxID=1048753 RepID=A0ABW2TSE2_9PSEU